MSSLMQFNGKIANGRVYLQACKLGEEYTCDKCGKVHEYIYTFPRKPVGMFGCWVIFRYNGEKHVPDLSVPITLEKMPRDAVRMSATDSSVYWHS